MEIMGKLKCCVMTWAQPHLSHKSAALEEAEANLSTIPNRTPMLPTLRIGTFVICPSISIHAEISPFASS